MTTFPVKATECRSLTGGRFAPLEYTADGSWSLRGRVLTVGDSLLLLDGERAVETALVRLCTVRRDARHGWHLASGDGDGPRYTFALADGMLCMALRSGVEVQP